MKFTAPMIAALDNPVAAQRFGVRALANVLRQSDRATCVSPAALAASSDKSRSQQLKARLTTHPKQRTRTS